MVDYNLTLILSVNNPLDVLGVFNLYTYGFFTLTFILVLASLSLMWLYRENYNMAKGTAITLLSLLIPSIYLSTIEKFGKPLIPEWYIVVHVIFLALSLMIVWNDK